MTKEQLILSANSIHLPSLEAQKAYENHQEALAEKVTDMMLSRDDIEKLVGVSGKDMMRDNHKNHARFISHLFKEFSGSVLVDTVYWVFKNYKSHGFSRIYWSAQLNCWLKAMKEILKPSDYDELSPLYDWLIINLASLQDLEDK